jgi:hypothetical protein
LLNYEVKKVDIPQNFWKNIACALLSEFPLLFVAVSLSGRLHFK